VLTLRTFYPGDHLRFDAAGKLSEPVTPGPWTTAGQIRVKDISLKDGVVHIRGQRLFLFFDRAIHQLRDLGLVTGNDTAAKFFHREKVGKWAEEAGATEIELDCGTPQPEMKDVTRAMNAVFHGVDDPVADAVPDYWGAYFHSITSEQATAPRIRPGVIPPRVTYGPDPEYSVLARQAGYQGTCVLWLILGQDGRTQTVRIVRALGMGLDEEAVKVVKRWKFDPATKNGDPVAVQLNIEVDFKLSFDAPSQ
jgi:TonB family protein